jgi:hypothetical protein
VGRQEIKAFALAPLPVLVPLLLAIGVNAVVGDTGDAGATGVFLAMLAFTLFGYGTTVLIGLPIHLVLQRSHKVGLINYLSLTILPFALFAGAIAVWLQLASAPVPPVNPFGLYMQGSVVIEWMLVSAAIASLSAATFWYVGVKQR